MGYKGVEDALKAIAGETLESYADTGVTVVTKDNMDEEGDQRTARSNYQKNRLSRTL